MRKRAPRARVEWAALGAVLAAFAGETAVDLYVSRRAIETTQRSRLEHQAHLVEQMLATRFWATGNSLDVLRDELPVLRQGPGGFARVSDRMHGMAESLPEARTFVHVDARGRALASNRQAVVGADFREGERFRLISAHPAASTLYVSPPFLTPLGNWALSLGRVVLDERGGFDGYLLAIIDPEYWRQLLESVRFAPDVSAAVLHGGGQVVHRAPRPAGDAAQGAAAGPLLEAHLRSGRDLSFWGRALTEGGGEGMVVLQTIRPASEADQVLVASFSRQASAYLAPWRKELRAHLALVGATSLAAAVLLLVHQRRRAARTREEADREAERQAQAAARTALQEQLAQAQKMESVGRLAGGVAHDFNNLLTVILANSGDLARQLPAGDPHREAALDIEKAARRAAELTRQLLAFSRRQVLQPRIVDVNRLVSELRSMLRRLIGEDIELALVLAPDLGPCRLDPGQLEQVIVNLAERLRERARGLRVVFMSGYAEDVIVHHGMLDPGIDFLPKPVTSDALAAKLRQALDR